MTAVEFDVLDDADAQVVLLAVQHDVAGQHVAVEVGSIHVAGVRQRERDAHAVDPNVGAGNRDPQVREVAAVRAQRGRHVEQPLAIGGSVGRRGGARHRSAWRQHLDRDGGAGAADGAADSGDGEGGDKAGTCRTRAGW